MLITWIKLLELDETVNLKAINMKITFDQKDFFFDWFQRL